MCDGTDLITSQTYRKHVTITWHGTDRVTFPMRNPVVLEATLRRVRSDGATCGLPLVHCVHLLSVATQIMLELILTFLAVPLQFPVGWEHCGRYETHPSHNTIAPTGCNIRGMVPSAWLPSEIRIRQRQDACNQLLKRIYRIEP